MLRLTLKILFVSLLALGIGACGASADEGAKQAREETESEPDSATSDGANAGDDGEGATMQGQDPTGSSEAEGPDDSTANGSASDTTEQTSSDSAGDTGADRGSDDRSDAAAAEADVVEEPRVPESPSLGRLTIEMGEVEVPSSLGVYFQDVGEDEVTADLTYHFALGDDYPSEFTLALDSSLVIPCWGVAGTAEEQGDWVVESVTSSGDAVSVEAAGSEGFSVRLNDVGVTTATLTGHFFPVDPEACELSFEFTDGVPFSIEFSASVHRPAGVRVDFESATDFFFPREACTQVLSGTRLFPKNLFGALTLVNEGGVEFSASNVHRWRPVTVTVIATPDTELGLLDESEGLNALYAKGPNQTLRIESEWGPLGEIDLVSPESIDEMSVIYELHGVGRSPILLNPGEEMEGYWEPSPAWITARPRLRANGNEICSIPPAEHFALSSDTPEICDLAEPPCTSCDVDLAATARVFAMGRCELALSAPHYNSGQGLVVDWYGDFVPRVEEE